MLVRLKKRGSLNPHGMTPGAPKARPGMWHGAVIEVEPTLNYSRWCGSKTIYRVTDHRLVAPGTYAHICPHCLIDDLDAYESDHDDEQAEVGDIAFANAYAKVKQ